jgi:hypothetical protein
LPNLSISIKRFYDEDFQEYRADIVYEVPFRNNLRKHVKIYIIVEHKSYNYPHSISQLFIYESQIIRLEIIDAKNNKIYTSDYKLSPILLIMLYHGDGAYTGSVELIDEFEKIDGAVDLTINQKCLVVDLSAISKSDLPRDPEVPELYSALRVMQAIKSKDLDKILCEEQFLSELRSSSHDTERVDFARLLACYVFDNGSHLTQKGVEQINQQFQKTFRGEKIMLSPFAERYAVIGEKRGIEIGEAIGEKKGEKRGIEIGEVIGEKRGIVIGEIKGRLESRIEDIISILDIKFGEVSETVRDSLYIITDFNRLHELVQTAIKCDTFEEFDNELKSAKSKHKLD